MNYRDPNSVVRCAAARGFFTTSRATLTESEFVDQVIGGWWSMPGNYLTLETEQHRDKAEWVYRYVYRPYREFVDTHHITHTHKGNAIFCAFHRLLRAGQINEAIDALNRWKSDYLTSMNEQRTPYLAGADMDLLAELEALALQAEPHKALMGEIEREQDKLAVQGYVALANVHREAELKQLRMTVFQINGRMRAIRDEIARGEC